jgi:Excalibur calcium-binding domain
MVKRMKHLFFILFSVTISLSTNVASGQEKKGEIFKCDGRTHCSQMKSCEEAKFFLKNCPNPKMDGDKNGIPCEKQWCTSSFSR